MGGPFHIGSEYRWPWYIHIDAGVPETMIRESIQPVGDKPVVLFRRFGRTRPNEDEVRELRKHRSGLLIWIQP